MKNHFFKLLSWLVVCCLIYSIVPLYDCFSTNAETENDTVEVSESFSVQIQNMENYNKQLRDSSLCGTAKQNITENGVTINIEPFATTFAGLSKTGDNTIRSEYIITCDEDPTESTRIIESSLDSMISLDNIKPDRKYTINVTMTDESSKDTKYYIGNLGVSFDVDNALYVDSSFDDITCLYRDRSTGSSSYYTESTDSTGPGTNQFNIVGIGAIILGTVHSTTDTDYYLFQASDTGYMNFLLRVPNYSGTNLDLYVYRYIPATGTSVLLSSSTNTSYTDERCVVSVTSGYYYYMKITTISGSTGNSYNATTSITPSKAWFPQSKGSTSDGTFIWNTNKLDILYKTSTSILPFATLSYDNTCVMSSGCLIAAFSMVLANLQVQSYSTMYDFRYSAATSDYKFEGILSPDPFVVFLANNGLTGYYVAYDTANSRFYYNNSCNWSTVVSNYSTLTNRFTKSSGSALTTNYYTVSTVTSYSDLVSKISSALSSRPQGIILIGSNHKLVVTYENGTYYVYDPWSNNKSARYRKPLSTYITSSSTPMSFGDINGYITID